MIELRMLGTVTLIGADGREIRSLLAQSRRFALLAHLAAATPRGFHRRDSLLPIFWPELDQDHARTALRQALRVIRAALATDVVVNRGDDEVSLDDTQIWSDVAAFDRAIAVDQPLEALELYRGPLLDGFFISGAPEFEQWLESERGAFRHRASRAARTLVDHCEARGNITMAVQFARRAVALAPDDEPLLRRLIAVLDRHGDRASALNAYRDFARRMGAEYDAEPAAETKALLAAVRSREVATTFAPPSAPDLLSRVRGALGGHYRVERELARGRTATVFLAHDVRHDRAVAIKVLHPELAAAVGGARFQREIALVAGLRHPGIVPLYDSGEADGLLYFVMPHVEGESLRAYLKREPQLPLPGALQIARDVADALGCAHAHGVVHRDVKPENILLESGHALLADFGIACIIASASSERLTESGISLGTPAYMSPEQATGQITVDARSDVYSLGCVVYEMLTGAPPFTGANAQAILARHATDDVAPIRTVRATVPNAVEGAVLRALAKVPSDRFASAEQFTAALAWPNDAATVAPRRRGWRSSAHAVVATLIAALLLAAGLGVRAWRRHDAPVAGDTWIQSVAVLPLESLSADSSQTAFADGMTAALIGDLGRLHALRVIARQSVIPYRGSRNSATEIGRSLHVDELVEGTVQQAVDSFRVDLQLIDVSSGKQLWSQRFVDAMGRRFAVQDSISRTLAAALKVPITTAEAGRMRTPPTKNVRAYDLFLRARMRMQRVTREDDSVAIGMLERAVAIDSNFAIAQAWLATAYVARIAQFAPADSSALERAFVAVSRALLIDPDLAEGHWARARLLWGATRQFAHEQSVREDRRALELNPNLEVAHAHVGFIYLHIGLLDQAIAEFQKTLALDPGQRLTLDRIGQVRLIQGRYEEALRVMRQIPPNLQPTIQQYDLAWALMALGRDSEASVLIERSLREHPEDRGGVITSSRAILEAKRGDVRGAEADIQAAIPKGEGFVHFHHTEYNIAVTFALLRRPVAALPWLQRTVRDGWPCYPLFANDPRLDPIRNTQAFIAFLREQKAQWERYQTSF